MDHRQATPPGAETAPLRAEERLELTFARLQDELLGMLYHLTGSAEDARDAVQETFVKCWRQRPQLDEVENLRAWIFRIALNTGRDLRKTAWRRRRRPLLEEESPVIAAEAGPAADAARREQLALLRRAVMDLGQEQREVFLLRQNGDMTYEQIAEAMQIPVGTVKTRMRLALTHLRQAMEKIN
jgi:RNA polymerase sigma factor (sigma-70 family)